ncbi:2-oxo acid dehydrogenase subunit E2 [Eubacterium sp. 1001713B170207_170306_E7]|uniref:2-oxo acid dehydrogenase subunit E2 n=1 Tax=Eubacterium sp. 1001713B170207_170306_E7 TaxID=2787097 RepID=UPI001897A64C|nr:2-oxo acid dehydrogenase subunit E2 [Eubacterium sp. 1001713B170207_170306_E7]
MAADIILPKLGMDMQSGTIMTWYKNEGDTVKKGEPLFELMTDKVNIEVEAEDSGVLLKRYYETGVELPVFTVIGCIGEAEEQVPEHQAVSPLNTMQSPGHLTDEDRAALKAMRSSTREGFSSVGKTIRATPSARRLAAEHKIDLSNVSGSGPKGRIQVEDIEALLDVSKKVEKTEVPQQKVFAEPREEKTELEAVLDEVPQQDDEPKEIVAEEPEEAPVSEPNPGMAGALDMTLEDLVAGMGSLEAELGGKTHEGDVLEAAAVQEPAANIEKPAEKPAATQVFSASPLAEKMAAVENIDIHSISEGSGPDGRIMKEDVLKAMAEGSSRLESVIEEVPVQAEAPQDEAAEAEPAALQPEVPEEKAVPDHEADEEVIVMTLPEPTIEIAERTEAEEENPPVNGRLEAMPAKRRIIADRMVKSNLENVVITLTTEVDMTEVKELRKKISKKVEKETGYRCTYTDFLLVSVSRALTEHPYINSSLCEDGVIFHDFVNLGMAVGMDDGLIVPVIRDAHSASFSEMVEKRSELLKLVKAKKLTGDHFKDSTFTVTNLGMYGILEFTAIINQPNSAILSVGEVVDRVRIYKGEPAPRSVMKISLNLDHRVADGMAGAKFLQTVKSYMENPALLLF